MLEYKMNAQYLVHMLIWAGSSTEGTEPAGDAKNQITGSTCTQETTGIQITWKREISFHS